MSDAPTTDTTGEDLAASAETAAVSIISSGTPLRCLTRLPTALVDEARVTFDVDGISLAAVDPPNVSMIHLEAHAAGFESYQLCDEDASHTVGVNLDRLQSALGFARMRGDGDPISVDLFTDPDRLRVTVTRPDQGLQRREEWFCLDPESIREKPNNPDLDLPCYADPDVAGFRDAVHAFGPDHAELRNDGQGGLVLSAGLDENQHDEGEQRVIFPNSVWADDEHELDEVAASSLFSLDYLDSVSSALKKSRADRLTVNWGDEFPVRLAFEYEEWGYEGEFAIAPRIGSGDTA